MISRYEQEDMAKIWSLKSKYNFFLEVEKAISDVQFKSGFIKEDLSLELSEVTVDLGRIKDLEKAYKHDVIAFTSSIEEQLSAKLKPLFHFGVTSSDIIDTSLMLQMRESVDLLKQDAKRLLLEIKKQIDRTSSLLSCGRTHGIYAEPMIFANKWLSFYVELQRRVEALEKIEFTGQVSGAIGTYSIIEQKYESRILKNLNLKPETVSTQVIPRDRILSIVSSITAFGAFFERLAIEFRHLQHSNISEVFEGFEQGQRGSSIMPHKKNPIGFENITGISRILSSYYQVAYSNCSLWHERDLSHSSAERIYLPDMFNLACYALRRVRSTISTLEYDTEQIESRVTTNPQLYSSLILHKILRDSKLSRKRVYEIVQEEFFKSNDLNSIISSIEKKLNINIAFCQKEARKKYEKKFQVKYQNVLKELK